MGADAPEPSARGAVRALAEDYGLLVVAALFAVLGVAGIALYAFGDAGDAESLLRRYGLVALLFVFVLEGAMLLYFAPSEALVPAAVTVLARTESGYDIPTVAGILLVAVTGATAGQTTLFLLARRGGRQWLLDRPWFRVDEARLDRFGDVFDTYGVVAVPASNTLLFTRGMLTVPAGVAGMTTRRFAALSALGTLAFELLLAGGAIGVLELL
ncbi:VTT domain-containing protein [Haloarcula sp. S1CR25-12]|uniref:VTT domain-containing protein n=1 Tax=Haloarcula saliterrae TaxID=2950534 RepID=A0ABU2FD25_9EURY|nr:VTT domain-containing protein [Haloarcula sp. S1CR25-12]MDS0260139.1 VTT domain-containing protein [Haloarcula sp. S1CR25-12]